MADADADGICDDVDPRDLDACGVCNGPGATYECGCSDIPEGDCDCDGNVLDECGICEAMASWLGTVIAMVMFWTSVAFVAMASRR